MQLKRSPEVQKLSEKVVLCFSVSRPYLKSICHAEKTLFRLKLLYTLKVRGDTLKQQQELDDQGVQSTPGKQQNNRLMLLTRELTQVSNEENNEDDYNTEEI